MRLLIGLTAAVLTYAQGTTPKPSASDYPIHGEAGGVPIGAEFMVHSFGSGEQMYVVENYLVVEVALYRPKDPVQTVDVSEFALRINGKKPLPPQPPQMVAASLAHPEWGQRKPGLEVGAGPVIFGAPRSGQPFPGSPQPRGPAPPRAPDADPPGGMEKPKAVTPAELLVQTAMPTDPHRGPVSGFLYFPYTGKTSSIKSLELTWQGASLKLR
jgi:hypothetical protein